MLFPGSLETGAVRDAMAEVRSQEEEGAMRMSFIDKRCDLDLEEAALREV